MIWVIRCGIFVVGAIATVMGLTIKSIYGLWYLCSDLVYVILFPHLLGAVHIPKVNIYGSLVAGPLGLLLRIGGGESIIGLAAFIHYPYYDASLGGSNGQLFPFRTLCMIVTLITLVSVSYLADYLFTKEILHIRYDYCGAIERKRRLESEKSQFRNQTKPLSVSQGPISAHYTTGSQNDGLDTQEDGIELRRGPSVKV